MSAEDHAVQAARIRPAGREGGWRPLHKGHVRASSYCATGRTMHAGRSRDYAGPSSGSVTALRTDCDTKHPTQHDKRMVVRCSRIAGPVPEETNIAHCAAGWNCQ
ncbi:hypothetical protein AURDEDRAFT_115070 [Auricularia subglabra TFB-10046 SS5]|nr:hypothetical protein AURDEDRAFT_115070 [Auricularia subglabra TFB-10046 SS5]